MSVYCSRKRTGFHRYWPHSSALSAEKVTPRQQRSAYEWVSAHWGGEVRGLMGRHHPKSVPDAGSKDWYKFVRGIMRVVFGFGLRLNKSSGIYEVVLGGFWKKHAVDVLAIALHHRTQRAANGQAQTTTIHGGRVYGEYPIMMRNCDLCPPGGQGSVCTTAWITVALRSPPRLQVPGRCWIP